MEPWLHVRVAGGEDAAVPGEWVLLIYRLPREPSTPRIALWRQLKRLGVAQVGDGLVALPADARTREQLEWLAEQVLEGGGTAGVWLARPGTLAQEHHLAMAMATTRAAEYVALAEAARQAVLGTGRDRAKVVVVRLRRQWREITRRDFFPPPERDVAAAALRELTEAQTSAPAAVTGSGEVRR